MRFPELWDALERDPRWANVAHRDLNTLVLEVDRVRRPGRTQLVEVRAWPGDVTRLGDSVLPAMVWIGSRFLERSRGFFEDDPKVLVNSILRITNDFQPFGVWRWDQFYYVGTAVPLDGLVVEQAVNIIFGVGYVADTFELTLNENRQDRF